MGNEQQKPNDGGPAFPTVLPFENCDYIRGMTLRDYFAANSDIPWDAVIKTLEINYPDRKNTFTADEVINYRVSLKFREADAMIAERTKGGE